MSPNMTTTSTPSSQRVRAFTLIEIMVVVGIIILLVAILIPALHSVKLNSKIASTRAVLGSLKTGLESYYNNFKAYPDSHPRVIGTGTYGTGNNIIPPGRGPALLAQALMGYLPGTLDGAGPDSTQVPLFATDPHFGFRTRQPIMVNGTPNLMGQVYGPYASDDPAYYKVNDTNPPTDPTQPHDQSFFDSFGNEILFFKARPGPTTATTPLFDISTAGTNPIFFSDDCSVVAPNQPSTVPAPKAPAGVGAAGYDPFLTLIAGAKNTNASNQVQAYPGPILGASSYLLISAGSGFDPTDGKSYFTDKSIVISDR